MTRSTQRKSASRRQSWKWYLGALAVVRDIPKSRDKTVLLVLTSYANNQGTMYPSQVSLALATGYSERAVRESLRRLKALGLINFRREKGFKNRVNLYRLLFPPYDRQPGHFSDHEKRVEPAGLPLTDQSELSDPLPASGTHDPVPNPIQEHLGLPTGSVDPVPISERNRKKPYAVVNVSRRGGNRGSGGEDEKLSLAPRGNVTSGLRPSMPLKDDGDMSSNDNHVDQITELTSIHRAELKKIEALQLRQEIKEAEAQQGDNPNWLKDFLLSHQSNSRNDTQSSTQDKSNQVCNICLGSYWAVRSDGGTVCERCHPDPARLRAVWENAQVGGSA
jgi:hypothetical protein